MTGCAKCGFENPPDSKFCASCGAVMPVDTRCPACGSVNPPDSKFCKQCGQILGGTVQQSQITSTQRVSSSTGFGVVGATKQGARGGALDTVKQLLWGAVGLYGIAAYLNYSSMAALQAYLGAFADTSTSGFLIMLDFALAGLSGYAAMQLDKGETGLAKKAVIANAVTGAITLFVFHGGIIEIAMNGCLLVLGVWGWRLLNQGQRSLI